MKASPYISVVMTSYNRGHYIGQAIDCILAQECNYQIEIIIGDDCSTDNSRELLQAYKDKYSDIFVLNFHEANVGFGPNWASTLKLARGKYVAFCDDDDYWCDTHHLQLLADYLDEHKNCGLVYANRWILDVNTNTKKPANAKLPDNVNPLDFLLHKGFPILFSATMIRKSFIDEYVDLDAFIRLKFPIQDYPTAVLLAAHCDFHYVDAPTVVYRSYEGSMSKPKEYETIIHKRRQEKEMNRYLYEQLGLPFNEANEDKYGYAILLNLAYQRSDYKKAHEYAKHCDKHSMKRWFASSWLSFHLFRIAKGFRCLYSSRG